MFCDSAAAGELYDFEVGVVDHVLHIVVAAVEEVDVVEIQPAGLGEEQELLHDDSHARVAF